MASVMLSLHSKQPKRGMVSCENGFIEIMEYPRAWEAKITDASTGESEINKAGDNADALAYFKTQQALYQAAVDAYTQKYSPLQYKNGKYDNMWSWVNDPWPWEGADQ